MFDGLLAKIQADAPQKDEPPIIALLRRLHAAGDVEGCRAIRDQLHATRRAALRKYDELVEAWKEAKKEMERAEAEMYKAKEPALLADALLAQPTEPKAE